MRHIYECVLNIFVSFFSDEECSVVEWNETVNARLKETAKVESERNLDTLMKWYIQ